MIDSSYKSILQNLVAFDTTSHRSNLEIVGFIREYLAQYGIDVSLVHNEDGQKANIYATIGNKDVSGIGLSGHTDVVPVTGQAWATDPFQLVEKDGRFYGRGTCDMKGFLACVLASVPEFVKRDLQIPIHLLFSYDEEPGCIGVRPMISEFGHSLVKPKMVIVGEPSSMRVVDSHKGVLHFETEVTGYETHSSMPDMGVNAVVYASRLIVELEKIGRLVRAESNIERFNPPFSSVHVGAVQGGTALNIVPKRCSFVWEIRVLPGVDVSLALAKFETFQNELEAEMKGIHPETSIITRSTLLVPSFVTSDNEDGKELTNIVMHCAGQNDLYAVSYGTEAGLFEEGQCASVICGPGDIEQAHKPDEFIAVSQMEKCMQFMQKLADQISR